MLIRLITLITIGDPRQVRSVRSGADSLFCIPLQVDLMRVRRLCQTPGHLDLIQAQPTEHKDSEHPSFPTVFSCLQQCLGKRWGNVDVQLHNSLTILICQKAVEEATGLQNTHTQRHIVLRLDYFVPLLSATRLPLCTDLGAYSMLHISPPLLVKKKKERGLIVYLVQHPNSPSLMIMQILNIFILRVSKLEYCQN